MGGPRMILCCLAAGAAALAVRVTFSSKNLPEFHEAELVDWAGAVVHSFGFGVVFAAVYEVLRARGALPLGAPGGLAYGAGLFLVGTLPLMPTKEAVGDPMELLPPIAQYLLAGAAVGALARPSRHPVAGRAEPSADLAHAVAPLDVAVRLRDSVARGDEGAVPAGAGARWNVVSVAAPAVGFVCGTVAGMAAPHFQWFHWGFSVWLAFAVVGLASAAVAVGRAERWWGITAAGLTLNSGLLFLLLPVVMTSK